MLVISVEIVYKRPLPFLKTGANFAVLQSSGHHHHLQSVGATMTILYLWSNEISLRLAGPWPEILPLQLAGVNIPPFHVSFSSIFKSHSRSTLIPLTNQEL